MRPMVLSVVVLGTLVTHCFGATINQFGGAYSQWPGSWNPILSLNDPDDGVEAQLDFVGSAASPGAYWAMDDNYLYFRTRVDVDTVSASTFEDTLFVLIDRPGQGIAGQPDYGLAWDTKGLKNLGEEDQHGLEFTVLETTGGSWASTRMNDIDGNVAKKLVPPDISNTGDGYIRTTDEVWTEDFGNTTLVDWAVSWDYLAANSTLNPGQTWYIQLGSIANATDHNNIATDVAGGHSPGEIGLTWSDPVPVQTQDIPEPGTRWLLMFGIGLSLIRLRGNRKPQAKVGS
ncbi:MAG: PEP-CTERM sorting domain-containing protein [Armatimonadetes bacterium]|nr:PEP-CTERM sorting domain-containing protein [Armatimonadota bacterium]